MLFYFMEVTSKVEMKVVEMRLFTYCKKSPVQTQHSLYKAGHIKWEVIFLGPFWCIFGSDNAKEYLDIRVFKHQL